MTCNDREMMDRERLSVQPVPRIQFALRGSVRSRCLHAGGQRCILMGFGIAPRKSLGQRFPNPR
jgi:hypothetical protein